jgi:general secretion pathway protein M
MAGQNLSGLILAARLARPLPPRIVTARSGVPNDLYNPFVVAETETLAASEVDRLVRAVVTEANGSVLSSRTSVESEPNAATQRIKVEAVIEGRIEVIQRTLFSLETSTPLVLIDDLLMQPTERSSNGTDAPTLQMNLTLNAFWRREP